MSDLIRRRRMVKQLGAENLSPRLEPLEQMNERLAGADTEAVELRILSFSDRELAAFRSMDEYQNLDAAVDPAAITAYVDELRKRFDAEHSGAFFNDTKQRLIDTVANKFMLGGIVGRHDRDGGSVDTIHNARQGVYATAAEEAAYANRGDYKDKQVSGGYHSNKGYVEANRQFTARNKAGQLQDSVTGKQLNDRDGYDLDHTMSAKEVHDDAGRVLAGLDGPAMANRAKNLNPTDASINRSKKQASADEFLARLKEQESARVARIRELKSQPGLSDKEKGELRKLEQLQSVDAERLKKLDKASRDEYEATVNKTYYLSPKFLGNVGKTSLKEGAKMGIQQVIGLFVTEAIAAVFDEIRDACKKGADRVHGFWEDLKARLERIVQRVIAKWKEALEAGFSGMLSGIFSNLVTVLINAFMTTAKNMVRLIREGFFSIVKAAKLLLNPPEGMTKEQAFHEAGKIIIGALVVSIGILLEESIAVLPPMTAIRNIPVIGELLYSVVFGFMTGLVTSLALWGWDKLDLFGVKETARHRFVMDILEQDRLQILAQREEWLERLKTRDPVRYLLLNEELGAM
jgi:hypothetical protein